MSSVPKLFFGCCLESLGVCIVWANALLIKVFGSEISPILPFQSIKMNMVSLEILFVFQRLKYFAIE